MYKNDYSAYFRLLIMSPDPYFYFIFVSGAYSITIRNIVMVHGRIIEQVSMECLYKNDNSAYLRLSIMSPDPYSSFKNDNSAYFRLLIMSPDPCFYFNFVSGA